MMKRAFVRTVVSMTVVVIVVVVLDQVTKLAVLHRIPFGSHVPVIPGFFDLTLAFNKGAAFGILADIAHDGLRHLLLGLSAFVALGVVLYFLLNEYREDPVGRFALSLVIGGAVGNIIDRVRLGHVVDFLDFSLWGYHWPAFNVADSAICIGVAFLVLRRPTRVVAHETTGAAPETAVR